MSQPNPSPEHHSGAEHHNVVIVGGGTGGITIAARLRRAGLDDVTVVEPSSGHYNGYSSCPLVTSRNRMLLAEFDYDFQRTPSIPPINTLKPRYDMWLLKRYGLPALCWNLMVKGLA
jgi:cation diffusion facilitator CzcD-associated flavoprotein CzcO